MLLFNLKKTMFEEDTGSGNGGSTETTQDTGTTETTEPSLESTVNGSTTNNTQPNSDNGSGTENTTETTETNPPAWISQLPKDMRTDDMNQFSQISDLVKAYKELATGKEQQSQAPGPDAKPEDVQAFYEKLGKPKTADEYSIKENETNKDSTKLFKEIAFKANLTNQQAEEIHEAFEQIATNEVQKITNQLNADKVATDKLLHEQYGSKYQEKLNSLSRGMANFVSPDLKNELINKGLIFNKDIVKMLITLGDATAESGSTSQGTGADKYVPLSEGGLFDFKDL